MKFEEETSSPFPNEVLGPTRASDRPSLSPVRLAAISCSVGHERFHDGRNIQHVRRRGLPNPPGRTGKLCGLPDLFRVANDHPGIGQPAADPS